MTNQEFDEIVQKNSGVLKKDTIDGYDLERYLNAIYQKDTFFDYCPNGLQVAGDCYVKKIVTAVSASLDTIEKAIDKGADAIIAHHGIFWYGQKSVLTGALYKKVKTIIDSGIHLLAYHLPMDGHAVLGNSTQLAKTLGLIEIEPGFLHKGKPLGIKGKVDGSCEIKDFSQKLSDALDRKVDVYGDGNKNISTVGIVSGGGQREFQAAIDQGDIDCFITGEVSENNYNQAREEGKWFIVAGHYATERFGPQVLSQHLTEMKIFESVEFLEVPNPV